MLPLFLILKNNNIAYHNYADYTQMYIKGLMTKQDLEKLTMLSFSLGLTNVKQFSQVSRKTSSGSVGQLQLIQNAGCKTKKVDHITPVQ